ncbi:MAG: CheR family methyltransferase [Oryzihumus sp.]
MTIANGDFEFVSGLVQRESAITLPKGKEYLVEARLTPLARDTGLGSLPALVAELRQEASGELRRRVVDAMTTNETSWFRDRTPFEALGSGVLDRLVSARRVQGRVRIWSAGCSSGQEPYSIAMTVAPRLATEGMTLDLVGTDLSEEMVARCRAGRYTDFEMKRGLSPQAREAHFSRVEDGWQISDELRAMVSFRSLNLAAPFPPLGTMDVVFLRNVLIYFDAETKAQVLERVGQLLAPDGYLFLGAAETTINVDERFTRTTVGGATVYRLDGKAAA